MSANCKFIHLRTYKYGTGPLNPPKLLSEKGGLTIAYKVHDNGDVEVGEAYCNPLDNFCRRIGRAISSGRIAAGKGRIIGNYEEESNDNESIAAFVVRHCKFTSY